MKYKVKSITYNKGVISVNYIRFLATGATETMTLRSTDDPRPEMKVAFVKIKELLLMNFSIFKFSPQLVALRSISFKYGASGFGVDEISDFRLVGQTNSKDGHECKIMTGWIRITEETLSAVMKVINELLNETQRYIDGDRAQQSLFFKSFSEGEEDNEEEELDEDEADDEAEFDAVIVSDEPVGTPIITGAN